MFHVKHFNYSSSFLSIVPRGTSETWKISKIALSVTEQALKTVSNARIIRSPAILSTFRNVPPVDSFSRTQGLQKKK
jgi:hypothetical protein